MNRTHIRNLNQSDLEGLFDYRNDIRCTQYQRYDDTSKEYLTEFIDEYKASNFLSLEPEQHYAVCLYDGGLIGDLTIFYTEEDNCFTIGITISYNYQKLGFAYEVLHEVVEKLEAAYPSVDIVALIEKENVGSLSLFKKLEFVEECYEESMGSYIYVRYGKG